MNYKQIVKSRSLRRLILRCLWFIPDKLMIKMQYYIKTGRKLDLKCPKRFTEKLQWYKLHYRNPLMRVCVDKFEVRSYVKDCGYENILNPIIGLYDSPDEIQFTQLPKQFVIKDTLGSGGLDILICDNVETFDIQASIKIMLTWIHRSKSYRVDGREWAYGGRRHRIIIEELIQSDMDKGGLIDYKFFCFNGRFEYLYVIADRDFGQGAGLAIFDRSYNKLEAFRCDERPLLRDVPKPKGFEQMIMIAEKLASPFPEVRVDLYYQNERIIFGELTFFDGSGYMQFNPDSFDYQMGEKFQLRTFNEK